MKFDIDKYLEIKKQIQKNAENPNPPLSDFPDFGDFMRLERHLEYYCNWGNRYQYLQIAEIAINLSLMDH